MFRILRASTTDQATLDLPATPVPRPAVSGRVLCIGHATLDAVFQVPAIPSRSTKVKATGFDESVGGMAANAACMIAALGGQVDYVGPIGDDDIGRSVLTALRARGVGTGAVLQVAGASTSHSAIIVQADGERLIISHHGEALERAASPPIAALASGRVPDQRPAVLTIDVRWAAGARAACRDARLLGLPVVLDGEMGNPALLAELVPQASHLIFSESGFAEWQAFRSEHLPGSATGTPAGVSADGATDGAAGVAMTADLRSLVAAGATLAAVTLGERGIRWARAGVPGTVVDGHLPAYPVAAVETLGAGDAFHGAFALALAEGQSIDDALRFAAAAAALRCTRRGGNRHLPTRADVLALLG